MSLVITQHSWISLFLFFTDMNCTENTLSFNDTSSVILIETWICRLPQILGTYLYSALIKKYVSTARQANKTKLVCIFKCVYMNVFNNLETNPKTNCIGLHTSFTLKCCSYISRPNIFKTQIKKNRIVEIFIGRRYYCRIQLSNRRWEEECLLARPNTISLGLGDSIHHNHCLQIHML